MFAKLSLSDTGRARALGHSENAEWRSMMSKAGIWQKRAPIVSDDTAVQVLGGAFDRLAEEHKMLDAHDDTDGRSSDELAFAAGKVLEQIATFRPTTHAGREVYVRGLCYIWSGKEMSAEDLFGRSHLTTDRRLVLGLINSLIAGSPGRDRKTGREETSRTEIDPNDPY